ENPLTPQLPGSPARIAAIPFKKMKMENEKWKIWERFRLWLKRLVSREPRPRGSAPFDLPSTARQGRRALHRIAFAPAKGFNNFPFSTFH
ncbi:hypothetical protein, partial [Eubacterium sp.]|uniref:hypothetical protein n=1 Tax=Eubacterium sp. TaxID=142586 RepID=UPI0026E0CFC7